MFEGISSPSQAMLWLAVIEAAGFTAFTMLGIIPMVRLMLSMAHLLKDYADLSAKTHKDQMDIHKDHMSCLTRQTDILIRLLAREDRGKAVFAPAVWTPWSPQDYAAAKNENHVGETDGN